MKVSSIVRNQYKNICKTSCLKANWNDKEIDYKINRLVQLGKQIHTYENGTMIVRAHLINFTISPTEIMNMWVDRNDKPVRISDEDKEKFNECNGVKSKELNFQEQLNQSKEIIKNIQRKIHRAEINLEREYQNYDRLREQLDKNKLNKLYA
ncbi:hypothetical protein [Halalkalibacter oceani]|uniref:hypothetical protein n=1 Tax=Halalkalibacter oceani TaxID=1653776 RepID=UPI0033940707